MVDQFKHKPSKWHEQYRTINELCLSIRQIHHLQSIEQGKTRDGYDNITDDLKDMEQAIIDELIEILKAQLSSQPNIVRDMAVSSIQIASETFNAAPVERSNHFMFGLLFLMQELVDVLNPGKFGDAVINLALDVAQTSPEEYVQLKAFELLAALDRKEKSPEWMKYKVDLFLSSREASIKDRAEKQWDTMRERVCKLDLYYDKLKRQFLSIQSESVPPKVLPPSKRFADESFRTCLIRLPHVKQSQIFAI